MLVSAKEMLEKAKAGHYAVGQFNINNIITVSFQKRKYYFSTMKLIRLQRL